MNEIKNYLRKIPSFFFMSFEAKKERIRVAQGTGVTSSEALLTPKGLGCVPRTLAMEGSLGRKLSNYIHHIY